MNSELYIKNKGIRVTKHKIVIFELFSTHKHLDANQIYDILHQQNINIGLATIYRILTNFELNAIIKKHNFNQEQATYELTEHNEHHDHLICLKCHQVIEFVDDQIELLQQQIATKHNFTMTHHILNIYGHCKFCLI